MIKLRPPESRTFGGIEGQPPKIEDDGSILVHDRHADIYRSHGFTDWSEAPGAGDVDIDAMTKPQLIEALIARGRVEMSKMDVEALRSQVRSSMRSAEAMSEPSDAEIDAANVDPNAVTEDRILAMNRNELFAYLKANKVSSPPPVSNDELRARALDTFRKPAA